jgi:tetratricopeptide (TPR) repeat protein
MVGWVWRSLLSWFRHSFNEGKQPQRQEATRKLDTKPLTPGEYEHFFIQLLEGVEGGWERVQVLRALQGLSHRTTEAEWVTWLRGFGEIVLTLPPNRQLATRMVKFGEINCGELSQISLEIGRQLLEKIPQEDPDVKEKTQQPSDIETAQSWFHLGIEQFDTGNFQAAIASYDKALAMAPNTSEVWYNRGNALFQLERLEEAIASYDKALAFSPDKQDAWNNRGNALFKLKRMEEAIASWDKAVAIQPTYHQAWYNRGVALGHLGCLEEAIASYDKVLEIIPDNHQAWFNRGLVLGNLGRYEEAIASWDQSLEYQRDRYEAWYNRGVALNNLGRTEEADASFQQAEAVKPNPEY